VADHSVSASADRPHVLVMNDEQELLDLFQDLLEEEGFRVSTSIYLLDLDKVRELAPDVMVLDIMFEGASKGWPFITMARVDRELCLIPIVLCTAAVKTVQAMLERLAAQRVRVVYKPFDLDELLAAIAAARRGDFEPWCGPTAG
jgi:DNA-binding response OmpR family regulator